MNTDLPDHPGPATLPVRTPPRQIRPGAAASGRLTGRAAMFRSLRNRNYRLYSAGQLVSLTGTWMQRIAQDWLVLQLTGSGTALGVVTALQFAPTILLGPAGGMLADRADKRKLLLATQSMIALIAVTLGMLDLTGTVTYWHVLALAAALGTVSALDSPGRQSFVVELVGKADLPNAVALNSTVFNSAALLGPAFAGAAISMVGTGWAFIANAISSLAVLYGLAAMRSTDLHPAPVVRRAKGQLRAGIRYVRGRGDLMLTLGLVFVLGTFGVNFQITSALLAKNVFDRGASGYSILSVALALGCLAGALISAMRRKRPSKLFLVSAAGLFGASEVAAGLMPSFWVTAAALVPTGLAMILVMNAANANVQMGVAPKMRGRVMALYLTCYLGGTPFGAPLIGWASGVFGARCGMVGGGLVCLAAAASLGLMLARRRRLPVTYLYTRASTAWAETGWAAAA